MLKDMLKIDKRFENSINLYLDIDNKNKIDSYVYTRSSQNIMEYYLDNIENDRNHATMLIGPYGKGKSHLLLVLLDKVRHRENPYLPVIISGSCDDLNQAFLIGITDALKRVALDKLAPESYYSEAIRRIRQWKKDFPEAYGRFGVELEKNEIYGADAFVKELEKQSKRALELFERIYPVITNGSEFNPLIMSDTVRAYEQIREILAREYGYAGIYIIFDEFSKYIEGHERETFSKDMKVLQDMCELAGRSGDGRIYITCVAHKSIKEYDAKLPVDMKNAFRGVEARLTEVLFVVSSQNNYELIGNVIKKDVRALEKIRKIERYYENAMKSYRFSCFSGLFDEEDYKKYVVEGCFPLMPLTAYMLLHISEKVAQNERSIFTYLSHDEKGSLCRIVDECTLDEKDYGVTADTIYDYFKCLFRTDGTDTLIHNEWLKAEYALNNVVTEEERKVIKVIALIGIIDRPDEMAADVEHIACALNISDEECSKIMDSLIEKKSVIYRKRRHAFSFYNNVGVDIQAEIAERAAKLSSDADILGTLKSISELDYVLPKKYNQDFSMTRYFEYVFMTPEQISRLPRPDVLFEQHFSDGKIVAVVSDKPVVYDELSERLNDERIVVLVSQLPFNQTDTIRKYIAAGELAKDKAFIDENVVLEQELVNYCDDAVYEVNRYLENAFDTESGRCCVYHVGEKYSDGLRRSMTFNMFLSSIMKNYYDKAPIVNNELINRQNISAQNKKARNKIVDMILKHQDCSEFLKGTSPESTIYRAALVNTGISGMEKIESGCERVITEINNFIVMCDDNRCSFRILYDKIMGRGYGVRKGIIPIYVAFCLSKLHDKPVLSFKEKEVELNAHILGNVNDEPENYYLYVEHKSLEKQNYINQLMCLFGINGTEQDEDRTVLNGILKWYRALPQAAVNIGKEAHCNKIMADKLRRLCSMLRRQDYNPHDFLFTELPAGIGVVNGDYVATINILTDLKKHLDNYLKNISKETASIIRHRCGADKRDSLRAVLDSYYTRYAQRLEGGLLKRRTQSVISYITKLSTYDDMEIVSGLSKLVTDIYIDDWRDGMLDCFKKNWEELCDELESEHMEESADGLGNLLNGDYADTEDNSTAYFLKNAIKEAIDEFGDSLETKEKVAVLARVLAELVAGENT